MKTYDIAAYIWPAYTGDEPRTRLFWEEGIGEWQTVKNMTPKENYTWDRKPLWGYVNEADPYVMEMEIEAATDHGVNVFIYDWYWYDNRPFLENCLNDGFLKAKNKDKMQFYLMWANHDANTLWSKRHSLMDPTVVWEGKVNRQQFETIGTRWLTQYFTLDNYYKIDGKPVVSIYDMHNFITGLGGVKEAADAMNWLKEEAKKYGLPGVHFQFIQWSMEGQNITGVDGNVMKTTPELVENMGFSSLTHYQFVHFTDIDRDYTEIIPDVAKEYENLSKAYKIDYFPHVSAGWDNNPRFIGFREGIVKNNTPENFETALKEAKKYADTHNIPLITINSWNEWTETSYLEPDTLYGYGYLEAIKKVFCDEKEG